MPRDGWRDKHDEADSRFSRFANEVTCNVGVCLGTQLEPGCPVAVCGEQPEPGCLVGRILNPGVWWQYVGDSLNPGV